MNPRAARIVRALPFLVLSALSVWIAAQAPEGRKPFAMDTSLSPGLVLHTLLKVRHYVYISVLTGLAVLATGVSRLRLAFCLTMGVGVAWEVAQTTVVGRNARLADVAPNIVAGLGCVALIKVVAMAMRRVHGRKEAQAVSRRPGA